MRPDTLRLEPSLPRRTASRIAAGSVIAALALAALAGCDRRPADPNSPSTSPGGTSPSTSPSTSPTPSTTPGGSTTSPTTPSTTSPSSADPAASAASR